MTIYQNYEDVLLRMSPELFCRHATLEELHSMLNLLKVNKFVCSGPRSYVKAHKAWSLEMTWCVPQQCGVSDRVEWWTTYK